MKNVVDVGTKMLKILKYIYEKVFHKLKIFDNFAVIEDLNKIFTSILFTTMQQQSPIKKNNIYDMFTQAYDLETLSVSHITIPKDLNFENFKRLKKLTINNCALPENFYESLTKISTLKSLSIICEAFLFGDKHHDSIDNPYNKTSETMNLEYLEYNGKSVYAGKDKCPLDVLSTYINPLTLKCLKTVNCPNRILNTFVNLEYLSMESVQGEFNISKLIKLKSLLVYGSNFSGEQLKNLIKLQYCGISDCKGFCVEYLTDLPSLRHLVLGQHEIPDETLKSLINLEMLEMSICKLPSGTGKFAEKLKNLKFFCVCGVGKSCVEENNFEYYKHLTNAIVMIRRNTMWFDENSVMHKLNSNLVDEDLKSHRYFFEEMVSKYNKVDSTNEWFNIKHSVIGRILEDAKKAEYVLCRHNELMSGREYLNINKPIRRTEDSLGEYIPYDICRVHSEKIEIASEGLKCLTINDHYDYNLDFSNFVNVEELILEKRNIVSMDFSKLINLKKLTMKHCEINDVNCSRMINIEELIIDHCKIDNIRFDLILPKEKFPDTYKFNVTQIPKLKKLAIYHGYEINADQINNLVNIEELIIPGITRLNLSKLIKLRKLKIDSADIDKDFYESLYNLPSLRILDIDTCNERNEETFFEKIDHLTKLEYLRYHDSLYRGKRLFCGKNLKNLKYLNLYDVSDETLGTMENLEYLNLVQLTSDLKSLKKLTKLKALSIGGNEAFVGENLRYLTNLQVLKIKGCSDIDFRSLSELTSLKYLSLKNCPRILDKDLKKLVNLECLDIIKCENINGDIFKYLPNLQILRFNNCPNITDESLKDLHRLVSLEMGDDCKNNSENVNKLLVGSDKLENINYFSVPWNRIFNSSKYYLDFMEKYNKVKLTDENFIEIL